VTTVGETVAILGAGVMGETLLSGLLGSGRSANDVLIAERHPDRAAEVSARHGVRVSGNADAALAADTLVLVVKPQDVGELLAEIRDAVTPGTLVVSMAAGITTAFVEERLAEGVPVVRAMPNTPAQVSEGMAALSAGRCCSPEHLGRARALLDAVGVTVTVPEHQQDAVTAISGSGPAYAFYVAEAMIEAGVLLGLPRATSTELAVQTLYGAATMLKETGVHPTLLRERVSSPAGTTVAALRRLDEHGVRAAFLAAAQAARDRSRELAEG
jgi:pyrroline-5-carboxylate reductase